VGWGCRRRRHRHVIKAHAKAQTDTSTIPSTDLLVEGVDGPERLALPRCAHQHQVQAAQAHAQDRAYVDGRTDGKTGIGEVR
jgi:hypothetical protein